MKVPYRRSVRGLLAGLLLLSGTLALAVPKAAENAAGEVSIGAPTVHPKPPPKSAQRSAAAKPKASAAGKVAPRKKASAKPTTSAKKSAKAKSKARK
ncbi:MAG: hypothetical protein AW10_02669 [Candidatus Accumulibacter appositus]|uniref:Uncharacterized protein n=1 Tax=Candidatus Accumulibacter appositus TaxID=1454003 RepID=A0A011PPW0_9PROT|nr:hypothetical protein [Accumulibacter sp.]EXI79027.1 MAG: hypothetical protein AW10_02669 [Candidatus Accumulibacter appositus]HRF03217.1 hypothetical protein [Accumulibacter sp.]